MVYVPISKKISTPPPSSARHPWILHISVLSPTCNWSAHIDRMRENPRDRCVNFIRTRECSGGLRICHSAGTHIVRFVRGSGINRKLNLKITNKDSSCSYSYPSIHPSIHPSIYGSKAISGPWSLFQFLNPIHSQQDSLDGGSARRKAATYTQNNTNGINAHRHPCLEWDSKPRPQLFERTKRVHALDCAATVIG
jgi:hypothetical protein